MELLGSILADEFEQMAIAMRGKALQADNPGMKNAGRSHDSAHPRVTPGEDTGDLNSGERDAGRNRRQFTGGDVKQIRRSGWKLISNPNHMAQAMPTTDMGMRIRPSSLAPAGMRSPMLVVIEGGKR